MTFEFSGRRRPPPPPSLPSSPPARSCQAVSVGTILRIISRFKALSELGLLSVSMPSLEEREGRNCVVKGGVFVMVMVKSER